MAGGTFINYDKILPGVYIRYQTKPDLSASVGARGIVAIGKDLGWGEMDKFIEIKDLTKLNSLTGFDITSDDALFIREMTKGSDLTAGASKILLYRLGATGASKATKTIGGLTATAKYEGEKGNNISIVITPDTNSKYTDTTTKYAVYTVDTYYNGALVATQTIGSGNEKTTAAKIEDLKENDWVSFSGTGELTANVGTFLETGSNGARKATAYSDFLSALGKQTFNVVCYDEKDTTTKGVFASFVKRMCEEEGKYCVAVIENFNSANSEYVISVKNGVVLETSETLDAAKTTWWVSGASAGANYNESLTYHEYKGAIGLTEEYENSDLKDIINDGDFVFTKIDDKIKVVTDINSFTSFTPTKGRSLSKNRVVRTVMQICNDLYLNISNTYIGKIDVNADGVLLIKGMMIQYLENLQAQRALKNFNPDTDITVVEYNIDSMRANLYLQPVDSLEKIYVEILIG